MSELHVTAVAQVSDWIDGESLYGWCTRYHSTFGHHWMNTGRDLFGREHAARMRDLPVGLGTFCQVTSGLLGEPLEILRTRTIIGFYWPFLDAEERRQVLEAAVRSDGPPIGMVLALPSARLGSQLALRHCPLCVSECMRAHSEPTRFLDHQLPGSWVCTFHDCQLEVEPSHRSDWRPPGVDETFSMPRPTSAREREALRLCARLGQALLTLDRVDEEALRLACTDRLNDFGISSAKRINRARVDEWFGRSSIGQWLGRNPGVQRLPSKSWIQNLLRGRSKSHPLKWILLWAALWERTSVDDAIAAFTDIAPGTSNWGLFSNDLLAAHWCKPRALTAPEDVVLAFDKSESISEAALMLRIPESLAMQWLFDDPALSSRWQARRTMRRNTEAVGRLLKHIEVYPAVTLKELERDHPKDLEWLRAHSQASMRAVLSSLAEYRAELEGTLFER